MTHDRPPPTARLGDRSSVTEVDATRAASSRNAGAAALNVWSRRVSSAPEVPSERSRLASDDTLALSLGPKQPKQPRSREGHSAPQPALVTGPRQGIDRLTSRQTVERDLHSWHTAYSAMTGRRPTSGV